MLLLSVKTQNSLQLLKKMSEQLRKDCENLGIDAELLITVTVKEVIRAYRKEAIKVHPDKNGVESTPAFQELNNSYQRLLSFLIEEKSQGEEEKEDSDTTCGTEDEDERFMKDYFHNFNFPCENEGSFTVTIQHNQANSWQSCLEHYYGEPEIIKNNRGTECDRLWRFDYLVEGKKTVLLFTFITNQGTRRLVNS